MLPLIFLLYGFGLGAQSVSELMDRGRIFQDGSDWQNAYEMYSEALGYQPEFSDALFNRAECLIQMQDFEAAAEDLNLLLKNTPNDLQAIERRGTCAFYQEQWLPAAQDFSQVLMAEESVDLLLNRAIAYLKLKQDDLCLADLERCEKYEPSNARLQAIFGDYFLYKNNRLKARHYYKKALLTDPNNAEVLNNLGVLEIRHGNFIEAEKHFKKAIAAKTDSRIYAHLALAQMENDNFIEAMKNVALSLQMDQNESIAHFVQGKFKVENGNHAAAISDFNQAISIDPEYAPAYLQRAKANRNVNKLDDFEADLEKVLELEPENEEALKLLGR